MSFFPTLMSFHLTSTNIAMDQISLVFHSQWMKFIHRQLLIDGKH
jgi:hypothetical protein